MKGGITIRFSQNLKHLWFPSFNRGSISSQAINSVKMEHMYDCRRRFISMRTLAIFLDAWLRTGVRIKPYQTVTLAVSWWETLPPLLPWSPPVPRTA